MKIRIDRESGFMVIFLSFRLVKKGAGKCLRF
jgi:hypothetical protein